jgi:S-adenosylmethionine:tRNA ribosyltransferase-isomerase
MDRASDFDFPLPERQIAQAPLGRRDAARLYVLPRRGAPAPSPHRHVHELPDLLPAGALLVVNDTKVIPARLRGKKPTGGRVELLLCERTSGDETRQRWTCLGGASKPIRKGPLHLEGDRPPMVEVLAVNGEYVEVELFAPDGVAQAIGRVGAVPLPPYIHRALGASQAEDQARYQTIYAAEEGAVAAPTAGLHFTPELFTRLQAKGIVRASVTLHVGPGTFAPLRGDELEDQVLHAERYRVPEATAAAIAGAHAEGRPVVAVGTTVVRTLEAAALADGTVRPGDGRTQIFIRPGHRFRVIDGLLTNFHLPRSSLVMLVSAFAGRERVLAAYGEAIGSGYRFFSYGDAMLVPPEARDPGPR